MSARILKEVCGVQRAVSEKLVGAAVKGIGARPRDRVDHSSRGLPVLRRVIAGQDRKFLNGIYTEVPTHYAAGCAVGVIVEADAIQSVVILLRPRAGNGQLLPEPSIAAIGASRKGRLSLNGVHARLQGSQVRPASAIQWKFAHGISRNDGADVGTGELDGRRFGCDLYNRFGRRPHVEREIEDLLCPNRKCNPFATLGIEALRRDGDFVFSRKQVGGGKKTVRVGHDGSSNSRRHVGDGDLGLRYQFLRWIGYGARNRSSSYLGPHRNGGKNAKDQES